MAETGFRWLRRRLLSDGINASWRWIQSKGAIYPGTRGAARFGSFGADSLLAFPVATLYGESSIHIGSGTLIAEPHDVSEIGDNGPRS